MSTHRYKSVASDASPAGTDPDRRFIDRDRAERAESDPREGGTGPTSRSPESCLFQRRGGGGEG
jgi:hypothetical protein